MPVTGDVEGRISNIRGAFTTHDLIEFELGQPLCLPRHTGFFCLIGSYFLEG